MHALAPMTFVAQIPITNFIMSYYLPPRNISLLPPLSNGGKHRQPSCRRQQETIVIRKLSIILFPRAELNTFQLQKNLLFGFSKQISQAGNGWDAMRSILENCIMPRHPPRSGDLHLSTVEQNVTNNYITRHLDDRSAICFRVWNRHSPGFERNRGRWGTILSGIKDYFLDFLLNSK